MTTPDGFSHSRHEGQDKGVLLHPVAEPGKKPKKPKKFEDCKNLKDQGKWDCMRQVVKGWSVMQSLARR